jgi:dCMP deaminase
VEKEVRLSLDQWAFELIESYAKRGTCIRRQAGCLGLDGYNRIVGLGMNGVPRGFQHCTEVPCIGAGDPPGDTSYCWAIHAEQNMILNAHDSSSIQRVYVSVSPCKTCALMLSNLPNLRKVKTLARYADDRGIDILETAGVEVEVVEWPR